MEPNVCDRCKYNTNNRKCTDCLFGQNIDNMNPDTVVTRLVSEVMHANLDAYTTVMESRYELILQRKPWLLAQINDAVHGFVNSRADHWQQVPDPGRAPSHVAMRFNAPSQPNTQAYAMPQQSMLNYQQFPQQYQPAQNAQYPQADWAFNQPQYQQYRQPMPTQQATTSTDPWLAERGYRPNVAQQFGSRTATQQQNIERQPSTSRNQPDARAGLMKKVSKLSLDESTTSAGNECLQPSSDSSSGRPVFGSRHRIEYSLEPSVHHSQSRKNIIIEGRDLTELGNKLISADLQRRTGRQRNRDNVRSAEYQQQQQQSARPAGDQQSNTQRNVQNNQPAGNQQRDVHRRGYRDNRSLPIDPSTVLKDVMHIVNNAEIYVHKLTGILGIANREENPDVAQYDPRVCGFAGKNRATRPYVRNRLC
ncbi:putative uncharacterized protein DDB_G0271606 isoform X1 [Paramacrobiotus metropolitanus]|uniref:putative uncharacterized protein DDB_G0271606 isoform X1 n=1 Tax=Paramacrobiotus metropolitanus TaxID=2943436 RepID=UPI002445AD67|nr:putative uncharacterized protein DDB_G0271606 isoform X1 [Paramacrobiotus metropolitanus]